MSDLYLLDQRGNPVKTDDYDAWGAMFKSSRRIVGKTTIGEATVSTVFLGMDHGWGEGPPVLWETMVFGGKNDEFQERYTSRDEAVRGHLEAVKRELS